MGAIQSKTPFSHSFSYRRLPQSPDSQSQPLLLLDHEIMKQQRFETDDNGAKNKAMLKEIRETNSNFSRLETRISKEMTKREGAFTALKKDVSELKIQVGKLDYTPRLDAMKVQENETEKLRQRNADLEHEIEGLKTTVDELKFIVFNSMAPISTAAAAVPPQVTGPEMNDLVGCLVVLIFLISLLIGINI